MHNPWLGWFVNSGGDWAGHRARGSAGGHDIRRYADVALAQGTPVIAAFDGEVTNRVSAASPSSLYTAVLKADHDPMLGFYHLHLSRFVGAPGAKWHAKEGDVIGYSGGARGALGSGTSGGLHLHVNAYYGQQIRSVFDFFKDAVTSTVGQIKLVNGGGTSVTPAGSPGKVIPAAEIIPEGTFMRIINIQGGGIKLVTEVGIAHLQAPSHVALFERLQKASDPDPKKRETFNTAEEGIILAYLKNARNS